MSVDSREVAPDESTVKFHTNLIPILALVTFCFLILVPAHQAERPEFEIMVHVFLAIGAGILLAWIVRRPFVASSTGRIRYFRGAPSPRFAIGVLATGTAATGIGGVLGSNSYSVQIGATQASPLVGLVEPFTWLLYFGAAGVLVHARRGVISRRRALLMVGTAGVIAVGIALRGGIIGAAGSLALTLLVMALLSRVARPRTAAFAGLAVAILWPTLFYARERVRSLSGGSASGLGPWERFELDSQMALIGRKGFLEAVDPASWITIVRTSILPSFIDSGRQPLNLGTRISSALGGQDTTSTDATFWGNVYIYEGLAGVALVSFILWTALSWNFRSVGPTVALTVAGLLYLSCVSTNASYPEGLARLGQGIVMTFVAIVVAHLLGQWRSPAESDDVGSP